MYIIAWQRALTDHPGFHLSPQRYAIWASPRLEPRQATVEDDGVIKRADAAFAPAKLSFRQA